MHSSDDILAETIDQTTNHLLSAVRQRSVDGVARAALFINQSLTDAAQRSRAAAAARQAGEEAPSGPSFAQWITALDALAAAAIPAALEFMQHLHTAQGLVFSTRRGDGGPEPNEDPETHDSGAFDAAHRCLGILVNMCFYVVVAYRRTRTSLRAQETVSGSNGPALSAYRAEMAAISAALGARFTDFLPLLLFSADQQLWAITKVASTTITGHPCLHDLPAAPVYLSEHDAWVWLLVAVAANILAPAESASDVPVDASGVAQRRLHSPTDTPPAGRPASPPLSRMSVALLGLGESPRNGNGAVGATRSDGDDSGALYRAKFLSILLDAAALFLSLWVKDQQTCAEVISVWRGRSGRFPSAADIHSRTGPSHSRPHDGSAGLMLAGGEESARDVCSVLDCIAELISSLPALFLYGGAHFMHLIRLLATVAPLQLVFVASAAAAKAPSGKGAGWEERGAAATRAFVRSVSRLFHCMSSYLLHAAFATDAGQQFSLPPSEATAAVLQLSLMHIMAESLEDGRAAVVDRAAVRRRSTTGRRSPVPQDDLDSGAADPVATGRRWESWSRWVLFGYLVYMTGDSASLPPAHRDPTRSARFPQYCAGFAQCVCVSIEDVFSLTLLTKVYAHPSVQPQVEGELSGHGATMARRLSRLLRLLHQGEAETAFSEPGGSTERRARAPTATIAFSSLSPESLNAILLVVQRYEAALAAATDREPRHRQYWLLAVAYLRLSNLDASCTSESHWNSGKGPAYPFAAFQGMTDYVCAGPMDSIATLRDRSFETYADWVRKLGVEEPRDSAHGASPRESLREVVTDPFAILHMEVRDACDVVRERLLMSASRFLCVALRWTDPRQRGSAVAAHDLPEDPFGLAVPAPARSSHAAGAPPKTVPAQSQAKGYLDAFTRFLLMSDSISSNRLLRCLRTFQEELRFIETNAAHSTRAVSNELSEADINEARLFEMETALFTG